MHIIRSSTPSIPEPTSVLAPLLTEEVYVARLHHTRLHHTQSPTNICPEAA